MTSNDALTPLFSDPEPVAAQEITPKPGIIWLLDLDGVLNFFGHCAWPTVDSFEIGFGEARYRIRFSPEMITAILDTAAACGIDVRLCSTWCEEPEPILDRLGLPIPVAFTPERGDDVTVLKLQAALDAVRLGSRLIWTDDVSIPVDGPSLASLSQAGALLIAPSEMLGLTPEHLAQIRDWADPSVDPAADPSADPSVTP